MSLREEAETLNISVSYLSDILKGNRGCSEELMLNIKFLHPELDFTLQKPRYRLRKPTDKCNYMEYKELLAKYGIEKSSFQYSMQTYKDLDEFLRIITKEKKWIKNILLKQ